MSYFIYSPSVVTPLDSEKSNLGEDWDPHEGHGSGCHLSDAYFQPQMWRSENLLSYFNYRFMYLINIEKGLYAED